MAWTYNPKFYRSADGGNPIIREYLEANSQTFKVGQLVYLASGAVTATASDGIILGIALDPGTNVTSLNTKIRVMIIRPEDEIKIYVTTAGTATRPSAANLGIGYSSYVGSNLCSLDLADTGETFQITKLLYEPDQSTVSYWCIATVLATKLQYAAGA
jgi:hypothetical protein